MHPASFPGSWDSRAGLECEREGHVIDRDALSSHSTVECDGGPGSVALRESPDHGVPKEGVWRLDSVEEAEGEGKVRRGEGVGEEYLGEEGGVPVRAGDGEVGVELSAGFHGRCCSARRRA